MKPSAEYVRYVLEQFESLASFQRISTARFFGGVGLTDGRAQFAMMIGNALYYVVDDTTRSKYERAGMQAFAYQTRNGLVQVRRYFELPEEVLTEGTRLRAWTSEAMQIAATSAVHKKKALSQRAPG